MGYGYTGYTTYIIDRDDLRRLVPEQYKNLVTLLKEIPEEDLEIDDCFRKLHRIVEDRQYYIEDLTDLYPNFKDLEDKCDLVEKAWESLSQAFSDYTEVDSACLHIYISYHNQEDCGARYDEVDGYFFEVTNAEQLTPPAKKIEHLLSKVSYVVGG